MQQLHHSLLRVTATCRADPTLSCAGRHCLLYRVNIACSWQLLTMLALTQTLGGWTQERLIQRSQHGSAEQILKGCGPGYSVLKSSPDSSTPAQLDKGLKCTTASSCMLATDPWFPAQVAHACVQGGGHSFSTPAPPMPPLWCLHAELALKPKSLWCLHAELALNPKP